MNFLNKRLIINSFLGLLISNYLSAQDWQKRHQFAESYFGLDMITVPAYGNSFYLDQGNLQEFERGSFITPAINIGATHFWGHADLYVSISTASISLNKDKVKTLTNFGTLTGIRLFPFPKQQNKLRPFIGYKFSPVRYKQNQLSSNDFHKITKVKSMIDFGMSYSSSNLYLYLGCTIIPNNATTTYLSKSTSVSTSIPKSFFNISVNWTVETTQASDNDKNRALNKIFAVANSKGFFIGFGPSTAMPMKRSSFLTDRYPYLNDLAVASIFPDLSLGYHFTKLDLITAISYRPITQSRKAFDVELSVVRKSLAIEVFKFLGDYHGFAPFLGAGLSFENIEVAEQANTISKEKYSSMTPLLIFGWDIRPSEKGDWWVLRTNLRYSPVLKAGPSDGLSLQQLEFNFIQFVFYPQRFKSYKKL